MASKEQFCYQIASKYGLIVDFEGQHPSGWVDDPVDRETFGQWKRRVLGEGAENITVYLPIGDVSSSKHLSTIQQTAHAEHVQKVFRALSDSKAVARKSAVRTATRKTEIAWSGFPKAVLEDKRAELAEDLHPATLALLDRLIAQTHEEDVIEDFAHMLLKAFDNMARTNERQLGT